MKRVLIFGLLTAMLASGCGRKGAPIREPGTEPPQVVISTIEDASTEPTKPTGTLF